jgi:ABC-type transport system involved in multi-copper enzyme maturation permease subunit
MLIIIKKEFLDYLQSIQFIGLLCFTVILFIIGAVTFSGKYEQELDIYTKRMIENYKDPSTVKTTLYRQPSQLSFISQGVEEYNPSGYVLSPKGRLMPVPPGQRNFKLPDIPEPDWAFIIKIVFSLYVVLLGYSAVSGEKEQGTLRQTLANPVGRAKLLAAKYLAIILTVMAPLLIGMIISLLIAGISEPQIYVPGILQKLLLFFLLSFLYLSFFALLSLLVSSLIHQTSLVLLALLTIWVLFAVMIPNTSGILAERFSKAPSEYQIAKRLGPMLQQEVMDKIRKLLGKVSKGEIKSEEELKLSADPVFEEAQIELTEYFKLYENTMKERQRMGRNISRISPSSLFHYAAQAVAGTGTERENNFNEKIKAYSAIYDSYILKKVGKVIAGGGISFMGTGGTPEGKILYVRSPSPEEYKGDKSDFPRFKDNLPSAVQSLRQALLDMVSLVLWNLILAISAFAAFSRSDVR